MIKKLLLILLTIPLFSCSNNTTSEESIRHYYSDVIDMTIDYQDVFKDTSNYYYLFYFDNYCIYCARICNEVVEFALNTDKPFYFINVGEEGIPTTSSTVEDTIGTNDPLAAFSNMTPQLSIVENGFIKETYVDNDEILAVFNNN